MTRLRILAAALGCAALTFGLVSTAAAQYPPGTTSECVQPHDGDADAETTFAPGATIIVEGFTFSENVRCFDPDTTVTVTVEWNPTVVLARTTSDSFGDYETAPATLPADISPGPATIRASGDLNGVPTSYTAAIVISGAAGPALPRTGGNIALLAFWAFGLLAIGTGLIVVTRRRWQEARMESVSIRERVSLPSLNDQVTLAPYRPRPVTWVDADPATDEIVEEPLEEPVAEVEAEPVVEYQSEPIAELLAEPVTEAPQPDEAEQVGVRQAVTDATARTSDIVSRLQEEISAWSKR